ncbi:MAG: hypothetical protein U0K86_11615 [Agathobacter sp.]|nr:hypothetical protein [Agathobacter sp.]
MGDFLMCIAQYIIIMAVLAGIAFVGMTLGIKTRKNKDAKMSEFDEEK